MESRLWSDRVDASASAFWELYLWRSFQVAHLDVDVHPAVRGGSRRPDFLVRTSDGPIYVEAVSLLKDALAQRQDRLVDDATRLLEGLVSPGCHLAVNLGSVGRQPLGKTGLRRPIKSWLGGLPCASAVPIRASQRFAEAGWALECEARSHLAQDGAAGQVSARIGVSGPGHAILDEARLVEVIRRKVGRYGRLDAPLVIAIHFSSSLTTAEDLLRHLYGDPPGMDICVAQAGPDGDARARRPPVWGRVGQSSRRVHGVLLADYELQPWTLDSTSPVLFLPPTGAPKALGCLPWPVVDAGTDLDSRELFMRRKTLGGTVVSHVATRSPL